MSLVRRMDVVDVDLDPLAEQARRRRTMLRIGLPGLPAGPARLLAEPDLLRTACVRAFLGQPRLVILELPLAAQDDGLIGAFLDLGAEARGGGACVVWLANPGPALRGLPVRPTHRLRLTDGGLAAPRRIRAAA